MDMSESKLPAPLLPATVDLTDFEWMPLEVKRLRDSETASRVSGEAFRAAVLLWCAAWHQVPAASLPDDELELAKFAGFGRTVKEWRKVKAEALRGFVKCSDGRLYHAVIAERAVIAWVSKLEQRYRTECERIRKWNDRHKDEEPLAKPSYLQWVTRAHPESIPLLSVGHNLNVLADTRPVSGGQTPDVRPTSAPREVKGEGESKSQPPVGARTTSAPLPVDNRNPRPEAATATPRAGGRRKAWEATLLEEGERKGLKPGVGESWQAFEVRVRGTREQAT